MYIFSVYLKARKIEASLRKRRAAFVLSPGLFFSPRNIKTQFEGNFFNRRLLKFPENCVLMFRGQKNSLGEVQKLTFFFENSLQIFLSYKVT